MTTFFTKKCVVHKAGTRRPASDTYKKLDRLTKKMATHVQINLVNGIKAFKRRISSRRITKLLLSGEFAKLYNEIPWHDMPKDFQKTHRTDKSIAEKATFISTLSMPPNAQKNLRFDMKNPRIRSIISNSTASKIKYVEDSTKQNVKRILRNYLNVAKTPASVAKEIKECVGLLPRHQIALEKYRASLIEKNLPLREVNRLADRYHDKLLNYRARMIARTETRRLTNASQIAIWKEGRSKGYFHEVKKVWYVDGAPCDICEPMDGIAVNLDDQWELNDGTLCDIPTDSHPNCMCSQEVEFSESEGD